MRFSDEFINRVRDASSIATVISSHTELKRSGNGWLGLCPFPNHREKTPSFSVSDEKQAYHCFGCKRGGGIYQFLQEMTGMSFPETVEFLAGKAGIPIPREEKESVRTDDTRSEKKLLYKINRLAGSFFRRNLLELAEDDPVWKYIEGRGLTKEIVEEFKMGWAPEGWDELATFLREKNVPSNLAEKLGLIRRRTNGQTGHYDLFRGRIMFPIFSVNQEVVGFGGRVLTNEHPKYINSVESPVFLKGSTLFGLDKSAKSIRSEDWVIVVEGYMDFIALYGAGIRNVVATLGTALTDGHAKLISRLTKNVVVIFDGDQAGQTAQSRSLEVLLAAGLFPRGLRLPDELDPDEAVRLWGAERFTQNAKESTDLFLLELGLAMKEYRGNPTDKLRVFERLSSALDRATDPRLSELYFHALKDRLSVDEKWIRLSMAARRQKTSQKGASDQKMTKGAGLESLVVRPPHAKTELSKEEILFLNLVLGSEDLLKEALKADHDPVIQNLGQSKLGEIFEIIMEVYGHDQKDFARLTNLLVDRFEDPVLVTQHLSSEFEGNVKESGLRLLNDCFAKLKQRYLKQESEKLQAELRLNSDPAKLEQFMNVQRERHQLK